MKARTHFHWLALLLVASLVIFAGACDEPNPSEPDDSDFPPDDTGCGDGPPVAAYRTMTSPDWMTPEFERFLQALDYIEWRGTEDLGRFQGGAE